jgi:uncharacterized iron-regulated protein
MFRLLLAVVVGFVMSFDAFGQATIGEANYSIFDGKGERVSLEKVLSSFSGADVVFLGESHDDAVAHYLQAEFFKKAYEQYKAERALVLSMEMFERDSQTVLNEYLKDLITEKKFLDDSRPWNNYKTDYRPLVEFAKQNKLPVIAANAPRRYVNMVARNGRDSVNALSKDAQKWLAPLPYGLASKEYSDKFFALMGQSTGHAVKVLDSQSLWDATMAHSVSTALKTHKKALVVHLNGSFHTEKRLGTPEHLVKYRPKTKFVVVTMKYEKDFKNFDPAKHGALGDFVILTDASVPRSFKPAGQ